MKFDHLSKQIDGVHSIFTRISFHAETDIPSDLDPAERDNFVLRTKNIHEHNLNRSMTHHAIDSLESYGSFVYTPDDPSSKLIFNLKRSPAVPDGTLVVNPNFLGQINEHFIANATNTTHIAIDNEVLERITVHLQDKESIDELLTRIMDAAECEGML